MHGTPHNGTVASPSLTITGFIIVIVVAFAGGNIRNKNDTVATLAYIIMRA